MLKNHMLFLIILSVVFNFGCVNHFSGGYVVPNKKISTGNSLKKYKAVVSPSYLSMWDKINFSSVNRSNATITTETSGFFSVDSFGRLNALSILEHLEKNKIFSSVSFTPLISEDEGLKFRRYAQDYSTLLEEPHWAAEWFIYDEKGEKLLEKQNEFVKSLNEENSPDIIISFSFTDIKIHDVWPFAALFPLWFVGVPVRTVSVDMQASLFVVNAKTGKDIGFYTKYYCNGMRRWGGVYYNTRIDAVGELVAEAVGELLIEMEKDEPNWSNML